MRAKAYERLTTGCLFVALASAIVFDIATDYHWVIGLVGVTAAAVSFASYLIRHRYFDGRDSDNTSVAESNSAEAVLHAETFVDPSEPSPHTGFLPTTGLPPNPIVRFSLNEVSMLESPQDQEGWIKEWMERQRDSLYEDKHQNYLSDSIELEISGRLETVEDQNFKEIFGHWRRDDDKVSKKAKSVSSVYGARLRRSVATEAVVIVIGQDGFFISSKPKYGTTEASWRTDAKPEQTSFEKNKVVN